VAPRRRRPRRAGAAAQVPSRLNSHMTKSCSSACRKRVRRTPFGVPKRRRARPEEPRSALSGRSDARSAPSDTRQEPLPPTRPRASRLPRRARLRSHRCPHPCRARLRRLNPFRVRAHPLPRQRPPCPCRPAPRQRQWRCHQIQGPGAWRRQTGPRWRSRRPCGRAKSPRTRGKNILPPSSWGSASTGAAEASASSAASRARCSCT